MQMKVLKVGIGLAVAVAITPAAAQTIDHGALEDMFGEAVTTSVTGAPQRVSDVPAAMIVISGEDIRRSGALNLAEALKGYAGIDVNRNATQQYDVTIRGGNSPFNPRLLVMINGRQVYLDHFGMTSWSNLGVELSEIRQVEIVKGPMSALFGFNAASGVINIITYSPQTDNVNAVSAEVGTDGARSVSAVGTVRFGERVGIRVSGGYSKQDEFVFTGPNAPRQPHRENVAVDAGVSLSDHVDARFAYNYTNSEQAMLAPGFIPIDMGFRTSNVQGKLSADIGLGLLDASVEYNDLKNRIGLTLSGSYDLAISNDVLIARVQNLVKLGARDTVRATLEYRHNSETTTPGLAGEVRYDVYAGGMMWDHRFSDKLVLNLAGRVDHLSLGHRGTIVPGLGLAAGDFDRSLTAWSVNTGLVFKPDEKSTFRIQAARGIQSPSLVSLGVAISVEPVPGVTARFLGNPGLDPTIVESAEASYTRSIEAIAGSFSLTAFYSNTRTVTAFERPAPVFIPGVGILVDTRFLSDAGSFKSYGAEMTLDGKLGSHLNWRVDYTYDVVGENFLPQIIDPDRPFKALTPKHKVAVRLGYEQGKFSLNGRAYLRSKVEFPLDGRVSDMAVSVDARVAWRPTKGMELYAVGENLTGSDFIDNGYARLATRARIGARIGF
jgi:outer membrane receptor for ferrienterochelin and colicins